MNHFGKTFIVLAAILFVFGMSCAAQEQTAVESTSATATIQVEPVNADQPQDTLLDKNPINGEVRIYTKKDGLPSDEVLSVSVMEDLPYVGTMFGVCDFDGSAWRQYPEKHGFPTDTVSFILVLENFGVMGVKDGFSLYLEGVITDKKVGARGTSAAGAGNSFYMGSEKGLYTREWDTLKTTELECVKGLCDANVTDVVYDGSGGVWVSAADGLYHVAEKGVPEKRLAPENSGKINAMYVDGGDALWAGTEKGLFRLPAGSDAWGEVRCGSESCGNVTALSGSGKHFWIGTTEGAYRLGGQSRVFKGHDFLPANMVNSLAATMDGGAWIATPMGIARIVPID